MTAPVSFRDATWDDAHAVAALHADSWRRHYREAYPEDFFSSSLDDDRLAVWSERLSNRRGTRTVLAVAGDEVVGFVHVMLDDDETWGALVDNLHVRHDLQRNGIASALMGHAAAAVVEIAAADGSPTTGMYLWVLELNVRAQAFYRAIGGALRDLKVVAPPAHTGVMGIRCVWDRDQVRVLAAGQP